MDKKRKLHLLVAVILAAALLFCFWPRTSRSNGTVRCYNSKALQQGLQALLLESAPAGTPQ